MMPPRLLHSLLLLASSSLGLILWACPADGQDRGALVAPAGNPQKVVVPSSPPPLLLSLSDPDGQELILEDLSVRAAVSGMLSLTEMEMRFRNPHPRRMEGRFNAVLPPQATISRFAKEVNGALMEGEVVERLKANQVYDQILQQMRDPALLEQDQGNRFSARIFPIEAGATVRILLSYTRILPLEAGVRTFALPLSGLPSIDHFAFRGVFSPLPGETSSDLRPSSPSLEGPVGARSSVVQTMEMDEKSFVPKDLEVRFRPMAGTSPSTLLTAGDFALLSWKAPGTVPQPITGLPWVFYVDTSASSADGASHRIAALESLLASLPPQDSVDVVAFDHRAVPLVSGKAGFVAEKVGAALRERLFLGGTDLHTALMDLASRAGKDPKARFVLVSDGVATLGKTERKDLETALSSMPEQTLLHALVLGSRSDSTILSALTAGRGRVVTVPFTESMASQAAMAATRLALPRGITVSGEGSGVAWIFPEVVHDVLPGQEVIFLARHEGGGPFTVQAHPRGGSAVATAPPQGLPPAFAPLLKREGARATLDYLGERAAREALEPVRTALLSERVRISVAARVMIPETTLLVLETEEDYRRFGLDRRALSDILTVGASGIEAVDRRLPPPPVPVVVAPEPRPPVRVLEKSKAMGNKEAKKDSSSGWGADKGEAVGGLTRDDDGDAEEDFMGASAPAGRGGGGSVEGRARDEAPPGESVSQEVSSSVVRHTSGGEVMSEEEIGGDLRRPEPSMDSPAAEAPARRQNESAATGSSPASPPAPPPPPPTDGQMARESQSNRVSSPQGGRGPITRPGPAHPRPEWTTPALPDTGALDVLRNQVRAAPQDRAAYNRLAESLFAAGLWKELRAVAIAWQPYDPENPQVYECLGESSLKLSLSEEAERAFASLVEVAPGKTELLQRAGLLLLRAGAQELAETPLRRAVALRPDRVNGYRHLAFLLLQQSRFEEAAQVLEGATKQTFPSVYGNVQRVIREELGYVYRGMRAADPKRTQEIANRARAFGVDLSSWDAFRVTLAWETDANDVDLHVVDPRGEECMYNHKQTAQGLELYEDITRGFGPEVVRSGTLQPGKYSVGVNYFASGPMGVSRGLLLVMRPDAAGVPKSVEVLPFRLVEGGKDMRLLTTVEVSRGAGSAPLAPPPSTVPMITR